MLELQVLRERRVPPAAFEAHYGAKYRQGVRKLLRFTVLEGPFAALRKARSKRVERRIERAQELVIAAVALPGGRGIGFTRDLGDALRFDPALLFVASAGEPELDRVALPDPVRRTLEAYLPVPACPLAPVLREEILAANPWLAPVEPARPLVVTAAAAPSRLPRLERPASGAYSAAPPARPSRRRVYLVGCGGYAREQILPHFRGLVGAAADHKARLIERYTAPGFPVRPRLQDLLEDIARDPRPLVIVSSYHSDHARQALEILGANREARVFLEKPPAVTSDEAAMLAEHRAAGAWIDVGYNRRYAPLTSGLLRELAGASRPWLVSMRIRELRVPDSHWYLWPNQGTRVTSNLCHWLDLAVHLLGVPREIAATAGSAGLSVTLAYEDGSLGAIAATEQGDDLDGVSERIEVFAGDRTLLLDDFRRLTVWRDARLRHHGGVVRQKGHAQMYASLRKRWLEDGPPAYPQQDVLEVALLVERVMKLVRAGGGRTPVESEPVRSPAVLVR